MQLLKSSFLVVIAVICTAAAPSTKPSTQQAPLPDGVEMADFLFADQANTKVWVLYVIKDLTPQRARELLPVLYERIRKSEPYAKEIRLWAFHHRDDIHNQGKGWKWFVAYMPDQPDGPFIFRQGEPGRGKPEQ